MKIINRGFLDSWIHGSRTGVLLIEIKKKENEREKIIWFVFFICFHSCRVHPAHPGPET